MYDFPGLLSKYTYTDPDANVNFARVALAMLTAEFSKREAIPDGIAFVHPQGTTYKLWAEDGQVKCSSFFAKDFIEMAAKLSAGDKIGIPPKAEYWAVEMLVNAAVDFLPRYHTTSDLVA